MIPKMTHSGKGKTSEGEKKSGFAKDTKGSQEARDGAS